jgi:hypothetical protein
MACGPVGARRLSSQTKNARRTHFASAAYCCQYFASALRTQSYATNPTHFQPRPQAPAGGLSSRAAAVQTPLTCVL